MDFLSILDNILGNNHIKDDAQKKHYCCQNDFIKKLDVKGVKPFGGLEIILTQNYMRL